MADDAEARLWTKLFESTVEHLPSGEAEQWRADFEAQKARAPEPAR